MLFLVALFLLLPVAVHADVICPVDPPARRTVHYTEAWATDPYSDEYLMGNVQSAVCDDEGNFYFLDQQLQEVTKFSADGEYLDTIVHKGEGPGEIQQVWQIEYWAPDQLVLPQSFPARVVRVALDGTPLDALKVFRHEGDDGQASLSTLVPFGDRAFVLGSVFVFDKTNPRFERWVGVIDRDGQVEHELGGKLNKLPANPLEQVFDEKAEFWEWDRWAVSPDGRVYRAPDRQAYLIEEFDVAGNPVSTIRRDIPARARTADEREEMLDSRSFVINGTKANIEYKLLDTEPPIFSMHVINGQLWVRHNLKRDMLPEGVWQRFSIHSLDGELIEERDLAVDFDPDEDIVRLMWDGSIYVIENGVSANKAAMAAFGAESEDEDNDEGELDAEPAFIRILRAE